MKGSGCVLCVFVLALFSLHADEQFQILVLGCGGGPLENNLSGYAVSPKGSSDFVALDAGSLLGGLTQVERKSGPLHVTASPKESNFIPAADMLRSGIKAYLITHPHLDHCAGLVINSPADTKKPILATSVTIDALRDHLFNWKIWPNFGSEGKKPRLNRYEYHRLTPGKKMAIPGTAMHVEAFLLSHPGDYLSTAFLLESNGAYLLYVGDTAPDVISSKKRLVKVWERIAPLIRQKKLVAIFIESSCIDSSEECALLWTSHSPVFDAGDGPSGLSCRS